ncbi:MAG: AAA family ATPase [Planctomycetes bacterium]|nr:AAA family ATPase [Planctomycetota bacterium]
MIDFSVFDQRPAVVAIAGPNGAGKTTFYHSHLAATGLRFVNADVLATELALEPYRAARLADALRRELLKRGESFAFETVFSDPVGDKIAFLEEAVRSGYLVVLCYVGLAGPGQSTERVAMRVSQGGHDVPDEKLRSRFRRTLDNLHAAITRLPHVLVFDNSDLQTPFRRVAAFDHGQIIELQKPVPRWLRRVIP